jgi:hypothetical protein
MTRERFCELAVTLPGSNRAELKDAADLTKVPLTFSTCSYRECGTPQRETFDASGLQIKAFIGI